MAIPGTTESEQVATITNKLRHFATVAYFRFSDCDSAWECIVWGMTEATLGKLISRDAKGGYGSDHRQPKSLPLPSGRRDWSNSKSHDAMPKAVTGATIAVISSVKHSRHLT